MVRAWVIAIAFWALAAGPTSACRLALVLAMDISSSVDENEDKLQRLGLSAALLSPEVKQAFLGSPEPVALAAFEWAGRYDQTVILEWLLIEEETDLVRAAEIVANSRRSQDDFPTAVGHALGFAASVLASAPSCTTKTIDVAGDGTNNEGFGPREAYRHFPLDGVIVNGLVIETGNGAEDELLEFYLNEVRRGPGAFVEVANGFSDYERAMRRKLSRELQAELIGSIDATQTEPQG